MTSFLSLKKEQTATNLNKTATKETLRYKYDNKIFRIKLLLISLIITGKRCWIQSLNYETFDLGQIFLQEFTIFNI